MNKKNDNSLAPYNFTLDTQQKEQLNSLKLFSGVVFEFLTGWNDLVFGLGQKITDYCNTNKLSLPTILQIKEKFGTLRFYYSWYDSQIQDVHLNHIRDLVKQAEKASESICLYCGQPGTVVVTSDGFYSVKCQNHIDPEKTMYTPQQYIAMVEEKRRQSTQCDVCHTWGADKYLTHIGAPVFRCDQHRDDLLTVREYIKKAIEKV